jgi:hypothetical protein
MGSTRGHLVGRLLRSTHGVASPAEYGRRQAAASCWLACHAAPLMRFLAPSARASGGVHLPRRRRSGDTQRPGLASPGAFRPRGFDPLDGLLLPSPAGPSGPERSWSSRPFRAFSSSGAVTPLGARCPPAIRHHNRVASPLHRRSMERCGCGSADRRGRAWLQGLAPRSESVAAAAGVSAADPLAALLGFGSLQGIPSATARPMLPPGILPRAFECRAAGLRGLRRSAV